MRELGLQTHGEEIHLLAFVSGKLAAGTHCGLLLPVEPESLDGAETCSACFVAWLETDDSLDVTEEPEKTTKPSGSASRRAPRRVPPPSR